jgi:hypothetical protein
MRLPANETVLGSFFRVILSAGEVGGEMFAQRREIVPALAMVKFPCYRSRYSELC